MKVDRDETAAEAVAIGGSATVEGEVESDVTAIGGNARIDGKVGGAVIAVGGSVFLGPTPVVEGDVTSVGGTIHRERGAQVEGTTARGGDLPFARHGRRFDDGDLATGPLGRRVRRLGQPDALHPESVLVCLVIFVAREPLERVDRQLAAQPWKCAAVGLAGAVFFGPLLVAVTVLLFITVVGCVLFLLYPFLSSTSCCCSCSATPRSATGWEGVGGPVQPQLRRALCHGPRGPRSRSRSGPCWATCSTCCPARSAFRRGCSGRSLVIAAVIVGFGAVILARFGLAPGYWPQRQTTAQYAPSRPPVPPGPM